MSWDRGPLSVSENGRYLVHEDGTPFFWLGDTAWALFHRFTREEAAVYFQNRRERGFNVIQAAALPIGPAGGLDVPNPYGQDALIGRDPTRPAITEGSNQGDADQYDWWDHVDALISMAEEQGLYIGLLPAFGNLVAGSDATLNQRNARAYGRFLGERYGARPNIIWILGGDRNAVVGGTSAVDAWRQMAAGIQEGAGDDVLMTYHPGDASSSGQWFNTDRWLDFNMIQSGHGTRDRNTYDMIAENYARSPAKPVVDGEGTYEDHPVDWNPAKGYFRDYDVRKTAYRSVFAGAFGYTYGHPSVWRRLTTPGEPGPSGPSGLEVSLEFTWREAIERLGAAQMIYLRRLIESRPILDRIADLELIAEHPGDGGQHAEATRASDGSYAMIYIPNANRTVPIRMGKLSGDRVTAWWYDPRTGTATSIGEFESEGTQRFTTPAEGPDWVLVLDDITRNFGPPGGATQR
ncbi:MAG: glycoside hydrolase family 140 protein [Dehalococcoidia bacterium]